MRKDSLVRGTLILMIAAFTARFLGAVQRVPLVNLLGKDGMATYAIAYNVYFILLIVATAGIPSALSKLVSERMALGRYDEANRIYRAAAMFAAAAGVIFAVGIFAAAPSYAQFTKDPASAMSIRAIAPALLFFPLIAIMRGYFQGRQRMLGNGLSQIVEQVLRLGAAIILAYVLLKQGRSLSTAVAGASFGGVAGSVGAILVMTVSWWNLRRLDKAEPVPYGSSHDNSDAAPLSYRSIYRMLFRISVPIVLFSITVPAINWIDSSLFIRLVQVHHNYQQAKDLLGIVGGQAQPLAGIPIILAVALGQSIVPVISSAFAKKEHKQVRSQTSKALSIAVLSGLPMVIAICTAARPLNAFIFGNAVGTYLVVLQVAASFFQIMMQTSGAILMGLGRMKALIITVIVGFVVKLACDFALALWLDAAGIVAATIVAFTVMTLMNLAVLKKQVDYQLLPKRKLRLAITMLVTTGIGAVLERMIHSKLPQAMTLHDLDSQGLPGIERLIYGADAAVIGLAVIATYLGMVFALRIIRPEEMDTLPAPLRRILHRQKRSQNEANRS